MIPLAVLDSSTLVSLAKVDALDLISKLIQKGQVPKEVYTECVEEGLALGYEDAVLIQRLFEAGILGIVSHRSVPERGLSSVDTIVLSLAQKTKSVLCANDTKLVRRAALYKVQVLGSPDLLLLGLKRKLLIEKSYRDKVRKLHEKGRLSESNMKFYLEVIL
jgi:predicted nucleic acid-binding protein